MSGLGNVTMDETVHLAKVGEVLREARLKGDRRGAEVEIVCDDHHDFVHFHLAAAHSDLIRKMIDSRPLPFKIVMSGCKPEALTQVIDWMYYGRMQFPVQQVEDYLAITAVMCMEQLQSRLENILKRLAVLPEQRVACINVTTDPRYKISSGTYADVISFFGKEHSGLSASDIDGFNLSSILAIVSFPTMPFVDKIDMINIAILWLNGQNRGEHLKSVLEALRVDRLKAPALHLFVSGLREHFSNPDVASRQSLHAFTRDGFTIELSCDSQNIQRFHNLQSQGYRAGGQREMGRSPKTSTARAFSGSDLQDLSRLRDLGASDKFISSTFGAGHRRALDSDKAQQPPYPPRCDCLPLALTVQQLAPDGSMNRYDLGAESIAEIAEIPNTFGFGVADRTPSGSPGNRTVNRYDFSSDSVAEIGQLPQFFSPEGLNRTMNRYELSAESVAEIEDLPVYFIPEGLEEPSRPVSRSMPSQGAPKSEKRPDEVIGKKLLTKEELEDLRKIPPICSSSDRRRSPTSSTEDTQQLVIPSAHTCSSKSDAKTARLPSVGPEPESPASCYAWDDLSPE